jgi:hypothetical protein
MPSARADIAIIGLTGGNTLRVGEVRDPIKSLVDCGIGNDLETVVVDGVVRMRCPNARLWTAVSQLRSTAFDDERNDMVGHEAWRNGDG